MLRIPSWLLVVIVVLWIAAPLLITHTPKGGTDAQAQEIVAEMSPDYKPWFTLPWMPNPESESLLFALQTGVGSAVLGYYFGLRHGRRQVAASST